MPPTNQRFEVKEQNISRRNTDICVRIRELSSQRIEGMAFSWDSIIEKVAAEFYLSPATIKDIHKDS